ncbi:glycosyltransferase [Flavobacterium sp. U410]
MRIKKKIKLFFRRIRRVKKLDIQFALTDLELDYTVLKKEICFNPSAKPKVSIIIPFYNQEIYTKNCLDSLQKNLTDKYSYEIILIDDNSSENIDLSLVKGIEVIHNEENKGFLKNVNIGIQAAKGEYIYLLNNDTKVQEGFLDELFFVFENYENVGAVGSKLINPDNTLQEAGVVFLKDFGIHQIFKKRKSFFPEVNYVKKVDYCSGCSLLFKRYKEDGESLNLLDEQFAPAYFEETDFCFDLKYNQRKDVYFTPFSVVMHYNGATYNSKENTTLEKVKRKEELFEINKAKFEKKWSKQIYDIQADSINNRILELYENKSIIFFSENVPEYDKDSGSNRFYEIIRAFKDNGYHVSLVAKDTFWGKGNPYIEFYQKLGVQVFYEYHKYKDFTYFLETLCSNYRVSWFYGPGAFELYINAAKKFIPQSKKVYDMVDIHHLRYQRALELEPRRLSHKKKLRKYTKIETKLIKKSDYVITISDSEKQFMAKFFDIDKLVTVSNIHYPKILKSDIKPFAERKDLLFIGSIHHPNVNALNFLYHEIMPIVWQSNPDLTVHVLGNIDTIVTDIHHDNFIFHGFLPSVEEYFLNTRLMVAPLQIGAGVKGKIGQAFEYHLPVVTTTIGAEGMFLKDQENVLIADTAEHFAQAILELYENEEKWNSLSNNSEKSLYPFSKEKVNETIKAFF